MNLSRFRCGEHIMKWVGSVTDSTAQYIDYKRFIHLIVTSRSYFCK
jgi:hypothetical protein